MKYLLYDLKYQINEIYTKSINSIDYSEFKKTGFLVKRNFISKEDCNNFINQIDLNIKNGQVSWADETMSDHRIFDFKSKDIFKSLNNLYQKYISKKSCNKFIMANRLTYKKDNKGSGGGWHRDNLNRRQLKYMIYLNDVNEDNGAFEYIPNSHNNRSKFLTNGFSNHVYRYSSEEINHFYDNKSIKFSAEAGTLIIFDSSGLHRGSPVKKGVRYAFTQYMFDSSIPNHIKNLFVKN